MSVLLSSASQITLLREEGYVHIKSLFSRQFTENWVEIIRSRLCQCAKDLQCTYQEYLQVASRWVSPSPVTEGMEEMATNHLRNLLGNLVDSDELVKLNIISKTPFSPETLPFHQDIAYSPQTPYQFSAWLALTDAPSESGPMEVIVGSHKGPIEPAVDFWDPEFQDKKSLQQGTKRKLPVKAGDLIIFDSRLWHGSGKNESHHERFALVTRWREKNYISPVIPAIKPQPFGMWTCKRKTEIILTKGLQVLFQEDSSTYENTLKRWVDYLEVQTFPFLKDPKKAKESLKHILLLNKVHHLHNGGDAQGILYTRLWDNLLKPLSSYLRQ